MFLTFLKSGASETSLAENTELNSLYEELHDLHDKKSLDAFGLYL